MIEASTVRGLSEGIHRQGIGGLQGCFGVVSHFETGRLSKWTLGPYIRVAGTSRKDCGRATYGSIWTCYAQRASMQRSRLYRVNVYVFVCVYCGSWDLGSMSRDGIVATLTSQDPNSRSD